jgi:hypothetical protein
MPAAVVIFTMTASRLTMRPTPSVTLSSGATGNEVGKTSRSVIFRLEVVIGGRLGGMAG